MESACGFCARELIHGLSTAGAGVDRGGGGSANPQPGP